MAPRKAAPVAVKEPQLPPIVETEESKVMLDQFTKTLSASSSQDYTVYVNEVVALVKASGPSGFVKYKIAERITHAAADKKNNVGREVSMIVIKALYEAFGRSSELICFSQPLQRFLEVSTMAAAMCQTSVARAFAPKVAAQKRQRAVAAQAYVGNWLPGSDRPAYLEKLPGAYGFDPLGLGTEPKSLERFVEAEVINGRWAMLGVAGMLGVEALGYGDWYSAPLWAVTGGKATYFGAELPFQFDLGTLFAIEIGSFAIAESLRGAAEGEKSCYPGFNPLNLFAEGDAVFDGRTREIKNGRLAMVAFFGIVCQHAATGATPLEALKAHLASPLTANFATNGVSLPF